ncbi:MAG: ferrochelatase [Magnetococcales bacterium]|nr:ferrochelatase [Magnetococcales bacterium]
MTDNPPSIHCQIKGYLLLSHPSIGVLLVQLGTPDAPEPKAVRRFLTEFLSDWRVVDLPRWYWLPLLHGIILPRRSGRSAALYQQIWRPDGLSPLLHHSRTTACGVAAHLGPQVRVEIAMRYGQPGIAPTLHDMVASGIQHVLIVPMFPQYSCATTASVADAVCSTFATTRYQPAIRFAPPFYQETAYIQALAATIRQQVDLTDPGLHFLFSFHGLPQRFVQQGDPYASHCTETTHLLAKELHLPPERWQIAFQSRFGREPWLEPETSACLTALPGQGKRTVVVVCPGFVVDCLETLEEIAVQGRDRFLHAGGERFEYIPALNDSATWIRGLSNLVRRELSGWLDDT